MVLRPGGYTTGKGSLAHEMMTLAGLANASVEQGLDRWGSLAMETLLRSAPELLIITGYRSDQASLANTVFEHPALARLMERTIAAVVPAAQWSCGLPESLDSVETMRQAAAQVRRAAGDSAASMSNGTSTPTGQGPR
jgi:iron complex transport system substrate-binding protein